MTPVTADASASMRVAAADTMGRLSDRLPRLVGLGADGYTVFGELAARYPDRFVDAGVAEANLVGLAAGLARGGRKVFVGSIAAFLIRRACEQIRNDVCAPGLDVTFVGIGGGLAYGRLGPTHHVIEDVALLRAMPNTTVLVPADAVEAGWALEEAAAIDGPVYVRLGARPDPVVTRDAGPPVLGEPHLLRSGTDVLVLAGGRTAAHAVRAADELAGVGVDVSVATVPSIKPLDAHALERLAAAHRATLCVEEHSSVGGLGSLVAELLDRRVGRLAIDDRPAPVGTSDELFAYYAIDARAIAEAALALASGSA